MAIQSMHDHDSVRRLSAGVPHHVAVRRVHLTKQRNANPTPPKDACRPDASPHRRESAQSRHHGFHPLGPTGAAQDHSGRWIRHPASDDAPPSDDQRTGQRGAHLENQCQSRSRFGTLRSPNRWTTSGRVEQRFAVDQCPWAGVRRRPHYRPPRADPSEMDDRMNGVAVAAA
jgi:hypothetical protein